MNKTEIRKLKRRLFTTRVYVAVEETQHQPGKFNNGYAWGTEKALEIGGVSDQERWEITDRARDWADAHCPAIVNRGPCIAGCRECINAAKQIITE